MNMKTKKTILASMVATSLSFSGLVAAEQANYLTLPGTKLKAEQQQNASSSRYIVKYKDGLDAASASMSQADLLDFRAAQIDMRAVALESNGATVHNKLSRFNAVSVELSDAQLANMRSNPEVEYIEEDPERRILNLNLNEIIVQLFR